MALFESYERRIGQITPVLEQYGMKTIEDAKAVCDEKELTFMISLNQLNQ